MRTSESWEGSPFDFSPAEGLHRDCRQVPLMDAIQKGGPFDQFGVFVGQIYFRGERAFTELNRRHIRGRAAPTRHLRCPKKRTQLPPGGKKDPASKKQPRLYATSLSLFVMFRAGRDAISWVKDLVRGSVPLGLSRLPRTGVPFSALSFGERGAVSISRIVVAKGESSSFKISDRQTTAMVDPPRPFFGVGEYNGCARTSSIWRGSLSVPFPGYGPVRLTGRRFVFGAELEPLGRCPD